VLTAAHCGLGPQTFRGYRVFFGAALAEGGVFADVADARPHPEYDPATSRSDLALLTIRQQGAADPLPLDPRALDDALVGQTLQAVGFGTTGPLTEDPGAKRTGTSLVTAVGELDFTVAPAPSQACAADSGGPALATVDGVTVVTGVVSHGDAACADHATYARVDVALAGFIQPYLDATAPGAAQVGEPCLYDEHCASGSCLEVAGEPQLAFCAQACAGRGDCPAGMTCTERQCRYPDPAPGAIGWPCAQDPEGVDGTCYAASREAAVCTRRCVAIGQDCPAGSTCENVGGIDFYCLRPPAPAGCAAAPGPGGAAAALLLLLAALARRR
jgi:uncharacterized protein (TIGR03382 family)